MAEGKEGELTEEEKAAALADAAAESAEAPPPFQPLKNSDRLDELLETQPATKPPPTKDAAGSGLAEAGADPAASAELHHGDHNEGMDTDAEGHELYGDDGMDVDESVALVDELRQACRSEAHMVAAIDRHDEAILALVRSLGGNARRYQRDRRRALGGIVSEVFSPPRVTAAAKMLPALRVIPGFALDLTQKNERGEP